MSRARTENTLRNLAPRGILSGSDEAIFRVLPQSVLDNMRRARDESALLWNILYPRAHPGLSLQALLTPRPMWGSPADPGEEDELRPFFWGFAVSGERPPRLDESLEVVAGRDDLLENDLLLVGKRHLILVEAKHLGIAGTCGRYNNSRCPEVHRPGEPGCRYWMGAPGLFEDHFNFEAKPTPDTDRPPCFRHYQLARTLLLARDLSGRMGLIPHVWLIVPRRRWPEVRPVWLDFAERVRDDAMWRRLRVLSWEALQRLPLAGQRHAGCR